MGGFSHGAPAYPRRGLLNSLEPDPRSGPILSYSSMITARPGVPWKGTRKARSLIGS